MKMDVVYLSPLRSKSPASDDTNAERSNALNSYILFSVRSRKDLRSAACNCWRLDGNFLNLNVTMCRYHLFVCKTLQANSLLQAQHCLIMSLSVFFYIFK